MAQDTRNSSDSPDNETTMENNVDFQTSRLVPVEHFCDFDAFDTGETVFSGLSSNTVLRSPPNLEAQDVLLNETSDTNPTLPIPNRPSDDSSSPCLPQETMVNE